MLGQVAARRVDREARAAAGGPRGRDVDDATPAGQADTARPRWRSWHWQAWQLGGTQCIEFEDRVELQR